MVNMQDNLLTAGQFAKLARTTKRTVLWYEQMGVLKPAAVADNGYRLYEPRQILDFQIISLLRQLDFSLDEIKAHLDGGRSTMSLFGSKREEITQQIQALQRTLHDLETYHDNLSETHFLVKPEIRTIDAFDIYYLPVVAPYASIRDLCKQLASQFECIPEDAVYLTIFEDQEYSPRAAHMRVGIVRQPGMRLRADAAGVQVTAIPGYDALVQTHQGDGSLLSLLWTELGTYRRARHLQSPRHLDFYELEFYHPRPRNDADPRITFEMHLPVCTSSDAILHA